MKDLKILSKTGIPIIRQDVSLEILARVTRPVARNHGCDLEIRSPSDIEFVGDLKSKPSIVKDVETIFGVEDD